MHKWARRSIGRGLEALLSDSEDERSEVDITSPAAVTVVRTSNLDEIPVQEIETNPFQPANILIRKHWMNCRINQSSRHHSAVTVRKLRSSVPIDIGERRYQASKLPDWSPLPMCARQRSANAGDGAHWNIQRENLIDRNSLAIQRLISECNLNRKNLASALAKRTTVTNYLRLLKLPPDIRSPCAIIGFRWPRPRHHQHRWPCSQLFIFRRLFLMICQCEPLNPWHESCPWFKGTAENKPQTHQRKFINCNRSYPHTLARKLL